MKNKLLTWTSIGVLIIVIGIIFFLNGNKNPSEYDDFAKCLTENQIKMYGTEWCSFCNRQKDAFGKSFQYIDFVDCDKNRESCLVAGIQGYPTWKIDGENYAGLQTLQRLSELSDCAL